MDDLNEDSAPLHRAAIAGQRDMVALLVSQGADINCKDRDGRTPLHFASERGHRDIAVMLASSGACINSKDNFKSTSLHQAAMTDQTTTAEFLLEKGADINSKDCKGKKPLDFAADKGHTDTVALLIGWGAELTSQNKETLLYMMVEGGKTEAAALLISQGANIKTKNSSKTTILHLAVMQGHTDTTALLVSRGADINCKDKDGRTPLHFASERGQRDIAVMLVSSGACINSKDNFKSTSLHQAAMTDQTTTAEFLLEKGADINSKDCKGKNPLDFAADKGHTDTVALLIGWGAELTSQNKETLLYMMVEGGKTEAAALLISQGANIKTKNSSKTTILHLAVMQGHTDTTALLVSRGADINCKDKEGRTPLHFASERGHTEIATLLVSSGAKINSKDNKKSTPLHQAAINDHTTTAEFLLEMGADINSKDAKGKKPLDFAAYRRHTETAALLIDWGSKLSKQNRETLLYMMVNEGYTKEAALLISSGADINTKNNMNSTPLHRAEMQGHTDMAALLVSRGADINCKDMVGRNPLHFAADKGHKDIAALLVSKGADIDCKDDFEFTPLHRAALQGHIDTTALLVSQGADINSKDKKGNTPIDFAVDIEDAKTAALLISCGADLSSQKSETLLYMMLEEGLTEIAALLISGGADVNAENNMGYRPLNAATYQGHIRMVAFLVSLGADINIKDEKGQSPLHFAADKGHKDIAVLLVSKGADIDSKDDFGRTPLYFASEIGHKDIAALLVSSGANINIQDNRGRTPLHFASERGHKDIAALIVPSGANINIQDNNGYTPLHLASIKGHKDIAALLVSSGAYVSSKDIFNATPLHWAALEGHTGTAALLISQGANINSKNKTDSTPLHWAAKNGHRRLADLLVSRGADINSKNREGLTPLFLAVDRAHGDVANLLVSFGADINSQDREKLLYLMVQGEHTDTAVLLILHGVNINKEDKMKITSFGKAKEIWVQALLKASKVGNLNAVRNCLEYDISVNNQDTNGLTPLHWALEMGHTDTAAFLISRGADINIKDDRRRTPLHFATESGQINMTALLISRGADMNILDGRGQTPLHQVAEDDRIDVAALLISQGADINIQSHWGRTAVNLAKGKTKTLMQLVDRGFNVDQASEALKHCDGLYKAEQYILTHPPQASQASNDGHESSALVSIDTNAEEIIQDVALRGIVDPEEFKGLLSTGLYESFWNRIYLAGACNVGKTTLASLLIGEDIPQHWNSTDGLRIYFGRNGIDLKTRKMIPLKKDPERQDVLSKVLRGRPNIEKPRSETVGNVQQLRTGNIAQHLEISSPNKIVGALNAAGLSSDRSGDPGDWKKSLIPPEKSTIERKSPKRSRKLSAIRFTSVHEDIKQELRRGDYKVEIAPSDLVDFGGQRSYDMTHQLFVQSKGAFTLLFDGRKRLQDPLEEYPQGNITAEDILKHWVYSILTYCGSCDDDILPIILFVATHSDCLKKDQKRKKMIEFKEGLKQLFGKHDQQHRIKYNDIFFINGKDINDTEVDRLKATYVDIAFQQKSWGKKMPMAWVPLELQMSEMRTNNFSIISKGDLKNINEENDDLALSEKQLDQFLKAQHDLGKIVYIEGQGLDEYIIVQPTTLVDILRSFITDERFWPKNESLRKILKEMTDTGKIKKIDLFKLWSQDEFNLHMPGDDFKEFVLQILIHLDILVASKRNRECFLVPCIVKRTQPPYCTIILNKDKTICLSYKLLKSSIPAALAFKLICSVLNVWPLEETDHGPCLFHNAAILCIDQSNKLFLSVKNDMVIIYLLNTTTKRFISKDIASCVQECLTRTITSCLEFYHRSFGNIVAKAVISNLFEIQVGEMCDSETCFISLSEAQRVPSWKCTNGKTHLTEYLLYWTHDKKQKDCKQDCAGLHTERLKDLPNDKHLARLSSNIGINVFKEFVVILGMSQLEWERIEYKHRTADALIMQIDTLCQLRKKLSNGLSFQQLHNAVIKIGCNSHILCQIFRDDTTVIDVDNVTLQEVPEDHILQELSRKIGNCAIHLGIELNVDLIEIEATLCEYNKNIFGQNYDILSKWQKSLRGNKTIRALMHALWIVDRRGYTFLKEKYNMDY